MTSRVFQSPYMHFAKLQGGVRFDLAGSGVADRRIADLGVDLSHLDCLQGPNAYGWAPLLQRLGDRFGADPACVVQAAGASFANHLAMAILVEPGDCVLMETPGYELMASTLQYLGADVVRFARNAADGFRLDPERIAAAMTPETRLVVVTDLHNPSSVPAADADLAAVSDLVRAAGCRLLVDEVYRELTFGDGPAATAFSRGDHVIVTSSLTKAYGLSGLRCGWILAAPDLAERMRRLNDLFASRGPFLMDQLALAAFDRLPDLRRLTEATLQQNLEAYRQVLADHPALEQTIPAIGTTVFPRLKAGGADRFCERLAAQFETAVVPGRFFDAPEHIRISVAADPATARAGFERIARCLDGD